MPKKIKEISYVDHSQILSRYVARKSNQLSIAQYDRNLLR